MKLEIDKLNDKKQTKQLKKKRERPRSTRA